MKICCLSSETLPRFSLRWWFLPALAPPLRTAKWWFSSQSVPKVLEGPFLSSVCMFVSCVHVYVYLFIYLLSVYAHEFCFFHGFIINYNASSVDWWDLHSWLLHPCVLTPPAFLNFIFISSISLLFGTALYFGFTL